MIQASLVQGTYNVKCPGFALSRMSGEQGGISKVDTSKQTSTYAQYICSGNITRSSNRARANRKETARMVLTR